MFRWCFLNTLRKSINVSTTINSTFCSYLGLGIVCNFSVLVLLEQRDFICHIFHSDSGLTRDEDKEFTAALLPLFLPR